ncbi:hypothetical protein D3C78_1504580 [compost metagenome]
MAQILWGAGVSAGPDSDHPACAHPPAAATAGDAGAVRESFVKACAPYLVCTAGDRAVDGLFDVEHLHDE